MTAANLPIGEDDLQAFIDRRLDPDRLAMVEAHIAAHPEIAEQIAADERYRDILRTQLTGKFDEPIPSRLRIAHIRESRRNSYAGRLRAVAAAIVLFAVGAGCGWDLSRYQESRVAANPIAAASVAQDASTAYRTFAVEIVHPVEVEASNEKHLLQWLSKRLGRPLVAPDLSNFGYKLMGGRLLPGGSGAAAQLMYDDVTGKRLTVYVQAGQGAETAFRFRQDGDAATFAWIDQGFGFAVTAAASRDALLPIAESIYKGFDGDPGNQNVSGFRKG